MTLVKFTNAPINGIRKSAYKDVLGSLFNPEPYLSGNLVSRNPAVNIAETETDFHIELAAPGLRKENFKINIDKEQLIISAGHENDPSENAAAKKYNRKEFNFSSFSRIFTLPESADQNNVLAEYSDGILFITIGKKEEAKIQSRAISVK